MNFHYKLDLMVFSSTTFLFVFLPFALLFYYLFFQSEKKHHYSQWVLLFFSLLFYMYGEGALVLVMLTSGLVDFYVGKRIGQGRGNKKLLLYASIIINLGFLAYFKYANFFLSEIGGVLQQMGLTPPWGLLQISLPLGISFYTFQSMSYTIDVYYGKVKYDKSAREFLTYVTMFPQLVAGPIVRYTDIADQLKNPKVRVREGVERFAMGLAKKVLIANPMGYYADLFFNIDLMSLDTLGAWIGITAYTLQIYFDFSGYSDMAIGLGHLFGFKFLENFKNPYTAKSIQQFWRKWHISLSTWFRDYLYIPLGGNRKGELRSYFNQFIVFFLCGLWHGASWNFVVWGVFHGGLLTFEKLIKKHPLGDIKIPGAMKYVYTMLMVMIGWVFFRAETLAGSMDYLTKMFSFVEVTKLSVEVLNKPHFIVPLIFGVVFVRPYSFLSGITNLRSVLLLMSFLMCLLSLVSEDYNPFIYFRF